MTARGLELWDGPRPRPAFALVAGELTQPLCQRSVEPGNEPHLGL